MQEHLKVWKGIAEDRALHVREPSSIARYTLVSISGVLGNSGIFPAVLALKMT
jgi:hypothetical protein